MVPVTVEKGSCRLWDGDGTPAESERDGHLLAFNRAFAEAELPWRWHGAPYAQLVCAGELRLRPGVSSPLPADLGDAIEFWICGEEEDRKKPAPQALAVATASDSLGRGPACQQGRISLSYLERLLRSR